MASTRDNHAGIGIVVASFEVELLSSDNPHIKYPARGLLTIQETGPIGNINVATFEHAGDRTASECMYGAPVSAQNPKFIYCFDELTRIKSRARNQD